MSDWVSAAKAVVVGLVAVYVLHGCTPKDQAEAARAAFQAELLACVAQSDTVEASGECRRAVKERWGIGGPE